MALWDIGEGHNNRESPVAYQRFRVFLSLGESRTLSAVCRQLGLPLSNLNRQARTFRWHERAKAFDKGLVDTVVTTKIECLPPVNASYVLDFQTAIYRLGQKQIRTCENITESALKLGEYTQGLVDKLRRTQDDMVVDAAANATQAANLLVQIDVASKSLQRLTSAAQQLSQVGRENWAEGCGVRMLLGKFGGALAETADEAHNETTGVPRPDLSTSNEQ